MSFLTSPMGDTYYSEYVMLQKVVRDCRNTERWSETSGIQQEWLGTGDMPQEID